MPEISYRIYLPYLNILLTTAISGVLIKLLGDKDLQTCAVVIAVVNAVI